MSRINLTLDQDTFLRLSSHAKRSGSARATVARELLREGLAHREALERRRAVAKDYAAGREDARELLADFEAAQCDLVSDED